MAAVIALLRGINVGSTKRMAMARLRELLEAEGYDDVQTYVQSGNVVVHTSESAPKVAEHIAKVIRTEWDFEVPVITRTRAQLEKIVQLDPLGRGDDDPKRHQVTFFDAKLPTAPFQDLDRSGWGDAEFAVHGRELYTWTPAGIHSDKMLRSLGRAHEGMDGTARNWRTICKLIEMAES